MPQAQRVNPRDGAVAGADPLVAVRAAWPELVGAEAARAAQPVAIERDELIVLTPSSALSHQLAFLEPEIVQGLRALPEAHNVLRLRFRVGEPQRPVPARDASGGPRRVGGGSHQPSPRQDGVLRHLVDHPGATLGDVYHALRLSEAGVTYESIRAAVEKLLSRGRIRRSGDAELYRSQLFANEATA